MKLCLTDTMHNFKWVKIIQTWHSGGQLFLKFADLCHVWSLAYLKADMQYASKKCKNEYNRDWRLKS